MFRPVLLAGALACALSAAACTPSETSGIASAVASGTLAPTLKPGQLTAANLQAAGFSAMQITKIQGAVTKAQAVASAICPFVPLAEGLANVTIASAASGTLQGVTGTVNVVCDALTSGGSYAALGSREVVTRYVRIGRFDVPVYGVRR